MTKTNTSMGCKVYEYDDLDLEIHGARSKEDADQLAKEIAENAIPEAIHGNAKVSQ